MTTGSQRKDNWFIRLCRDRRGLTLGEIMAATSIYTICGGLLLVLVSGTSHLFNSKIVLTELGSSLDTTTRILRKDVRNAAAACTGAACPPSGFAVAWLGLDMPPANPGAWGNGDVRYLLNASNNLVRQVYNAGIWGPAWGVGRNIVPAGTTASVNASVSLVTVNLAARKTSASGHVHARSAQNMQMRLQAPTN